MRLYLIALFLIALASSCNVKVDYATNECKQQPAFIKNIGFNPSTAAFSTSEKGKMGLVLLELNAAGVNRKYQHPTWRTCGWAGPLLVDQFGNCFVGPVPVINILHNPPKLQNRVYKVNALTGVLELFVELPISEKIPESNPYGILGFAYLCETNTLYVSTVQGSSRFQENGIVYAVDASSGKIIDRITGMDVLGMGISYMPGYRTLFLGSARTSDIYEVKLKKDGSFYGNPTFSFSLSMLGPRGDDKVRRIKFDQYGQMQIYGIEFNYNLTAPTEKQETIYTFSWNEDEKEWNYQN